MKLSEPITNALIASQLVRKAIPKSKINTQECFVALALDSQNRAIGKAILVAMGSANSVEVHPRDIFREAVKRNAVSIILGHNHPSGMLKPSLADFNLTERMETGGILLGIQVLDSIVVGRDSHLSKNEGGWR